MRKYRTDVSITWLDVLRAVEIQIMRERKHFEVHQENINHELSYKSVDREKLRLYTQFALSYCNQVFYWYGVLVPLRQFLGMKARTPDQLKIRQCFDFFNSQAAEGKAPQNIHQTA